MASLQTGLSVSKRKLPVRILIIAIGILSLIVLSVAIFLSMPSKAPEKTEVSRSSKPVTTKQEPAPEAPVPEKKPAGPPNHLQSLTIATANVQSAPVVPVGIEANGEMGAPATNHEIGWYEKSDLPVSEGGAVVLDGHVGIGAQSAVFKNLHRLNSGDVIEAKTNDGTLYRYTVYHVEQVPIEEVDMRKMLRSVDPSKQGLNIITCAGEYDDARKTYNDRVLVYAVRSA